VQLITNSRAAGCPRIAHYKAFANVLTDSFKHDSLRFYGSGAFTNITFGNLTLC